MSATVRPELRRFWRRRRDRPPAAPLHLMMLPAVAAVAIFAYLPMYGAIMAFQHFDPALGLFGPQVWAGWDNFRYVFSLPNFGNVILNTFVISAWKIVLGLALPVGVAWVWAARMVTVAAVAVMGVGGGDGGGRFRDRPRRR